MSKKSKKKKKAKKKALKKQKAEVLTAAANTTAALEQPAENAAPSAPNPKPKKIVRIKTALKEKKDKIKEKYQKSKFEIFESDNKKWAIALILGFAVIALVIQSWIESGFNPETIKTNLSQIKTSAQEAFKLTTDYDIINTEDTVGGHYMAPGENDKEVYSFEIKSGAKTVLLKDIKLKKTGSTPDDQITALKLYEGENIISKAERKNDVFIFSKFTSVLQPGSDKKYVVKADLSQDVSSGTRFKFSIQNPGDISIYIGDDKTKPLYSLDTYPFDGAYTTVVGWRKK